MDGLVQPWHIGWTDQKENGVLRDTTVIAAPVERDSGAGPDIAPGQAGTVRSMR